MKLKIITPEGVLFEGESEAVTFPGMAGSFDVLPHLIFRMDFYSSGIDHGKRITAPLCVGINSVPGYSGHIFHYAYTFP